MSPPRTLLGEWAWLLVDSLAAAGVSDVVSSPGSRSTPFVLAVAQHPDLRVHDVIDERAAGFFALGMARATGRPPLLLCTSGTAGAHYLPAVIEASQSHLPLLVLTADRPFELQDCAAPQTIDQIKLFGGHARAFFELGLPDEDAGALRGLRRIAAQAWATALSPRPGAVHLNARARKPLEPPAASDETEADRELGERVREIAATPLVRAFAPRLLPDEEGLDALEHAIRSARRGWIVCGPAAPSQAGARAAIFALAARTGFPILAEAASQLRFTGEAPGGIVVVDACDAIFGARANPDLVLQLGAPPTSGGWEHLLAATPALERWVIAPHGWNDPHGSARGMIVAGVAATAGALATRLAARPVEPSPWAERCAAANATAWREIDAVLADGIAPRGGAGPAAGPGSEPHREVPLTEGDAVRVTVAAVPRGGLLAVGNSLPIREVDECAPAASADCLVLSQRGANGIDGLVSGTAGAAVATGLPATLLLGDISLLHDLGGLALCARVKTPLVIVVLNNNGGRIFEELPVADRVPGALFDRWITPHGHGFEHAARQFGVTYRLVATRGALARALIEAQATPGPTLIEARVPDHGVRETRARIRARLDTALAELVW